MLTNGDLFDSSKIFTSFGNVKGSEFNETTDNMIVSAQRYEYIWVVFWVKKILLYNLYVWFTYNIDRLKIIKIHHQPKHQGLFAKVYLLKFIC